MFPVEKSVFPTYELVAAVVDLFSEGGILLVGGQQLRPIRLQGRMRLSSSHEAGQMMPACGDIKDSRKTWGDAKAKRQSSFHFCIGMGPWKITFPPCYPRLVIYANAGLLGSEQIFYK